MKKIKEKIKQFFKKNAEKLYHTVQAILISILVILTTILIIQCIYAEWVDPSYFKNMKMEKIKSDSIQLRTTKYDKYTFNNADDIDKKRFIYKQAEDLGLNPDLVFGILKKENPNLNCEAIGYNRNGSKDLGLFQINSDNIKDGSYFLEKYWKEDREFDPFVWKDNTILALNYLKDMVEFFGENNEYYIIGAYNAGLGRAYKEFNGKKAFPKITLLYISDVQTYISEFQRL